MWPASSASHRVVVSGAGGYLGCSIVRALVREGWEVRALVRDSTLKARVEQLGASVVVGGVLDTTAVDAATHGAEAIVHVASSNPQGPAGPLGAQRVRVEGCQNLLRAARRAGARRLVVGSGYWVYADNPGTITEDSPLDPRGESLVNRDTELAALDPAARGDVEVLVVRPGMVYGDGSWFRSIFDAVMDGTYRYAGDGSNPWSFVSLDDTGAGFARVLESGSSGQVYNLVDGRPAPWKEFGDYVADRLGRPRPGVIPLEQAETEFGRDVAHHLRARRAASAARIEGLGWRPSHPDFRSGLSHLLPSMKPKPNDPP